MAVLHVVAVRSSASDSESWSLAFVGDDWSASVAIEASASA